jgi:hypothetical protein
MNAPTFNDVAKRLADDDPPQWLVQSLEFFARLVGQPKNDAELETIERKLFASAKYLQDWLQLYTGLERYGFEIPVCVDDTTQNVEELLQFLAKQLAHTTSGDPRRKLCAAVCVESYRLLHDDHLEPHSQDLRQACEDLWQASGNPTTQTAEGAAKGSDVRDNWRRCLGDAAVGDDWVRSRLELYKNGNKIS